MPGASFCPFCGCTMADTSARPLSRSVPPPDRDALDEPCSVIYAGEDEMDVRRVGRLVAEAVEQPLPDVTRKMRTSKGFLATGLPPDRARTLAEKAERELKAPILLVADEDCAPLPSAMRMRQAVFDAEGLRCDAYTWSVTEHVTASWDAVFLISCGRLEINEVSEAPAPSPTRSSIFSRKPPNLITNTHHEFLLDIILYDPEPNAGAEGWRRLRLDQNTSAFSLTEMVQGPESQVGPLYRSSVNLERFALDVPRNRGLSFLATGAADSAWQSLTFLSKRDFDSYTHWLMQLVRYGRPILA